MIGALLVGFVAGVVARALMPGDVLHGMTGPASWGVSVLIVLAVVNWYVRRSRSRPGPVV
jgi:hypothetical protein